MNRAAFVIALLVPFGYMMWYGVKVMQEAGL